MRFCSRCGFALGGVRELVGIGAASAKTAKKHEKPTAIKGAKLGTWIILASFAHALLVGLFTTMDEDFSGLLLVSIAVFLLGFSRLLYAVFVQERRERKEIEEQATLALLPGEGISPVRKQLAQRAGVPVDSFTRPIKKTAEVVQPPSVTENTTRFFDDGAEVQRGSN